MRKEQRNLVEDMLLLRTKWNPDSKYPLMAQAAWLEAVERAVEAEAKVEQLNEMLIEKDKEIERLKNGL
ncbi:hypothetical protein [Paenibacillus sp. UNC451MF]|uniref:hypothetical protein n=1 Tax=Paenibacillus sp. UNC451MF TaxID=1449063 RepID=UPI00048E063C|nr:hypothetical protein [Paenibacillus sp. UNC451MF]